MKTLRSILGSLLLLCFVAVPAWAQPVHDQWNAVGTNVWAGVKYTPDVSTTKGYNAFIQSIMSFSGGAFDPAGNKYHNCATGGHGDYPGNECYTFDLGTLTWSRDFDPTVNLIVTGAVPGPPVTSPDPLIDSGNAYPNNATVDSNGNRAYPPARHTYGGEVWMDSVGKLLILSGIVTGGSGYVGKEVYWYDPATMRYTHWPADNLAATLAPSYQRDFNGVWDSLHNVVLFHDGFHTFTYDPAKPEGSRTSSRSTADVDWQSTQMVAAFVKPLGRMVLIGASNPNNGTNGAWYIDTLDGGGRTPYKRQSITFTGPGAADMLAQYWGTDTGLLYDPIIAKLILWPGTGKKLYQIDPATFSVTTVTWSGGATPNLLGTGSLFGRFTYAPKSDAYVLVNDAAGAVMMYRPTRTQVSMQSGVFYAFPEPYVPTVAQRPGKHVTMEPSPDNGRIYVMGGDYFDGLSDTESYRDSLYSLDAAAHFNAGGGVTGWRREYGQCGPNAGALIPDGFDFTGMFWDSVRHVLWNVPGLSQGSTDECGGAPNRRLGHIMHLDVNNVAAGWVDHGPDPLRIPVDLTGESAWASFHDPVTDRFFKFRYNGVNRSLPLPAGTGAWAFPGWGPLSQSPLASNGAFGGSLKTIDVIGRKLYALNQSGDGSVGPWPDSANHSGIHYFLTGRLYTMDLDTLAWTRMADPPFGGMGSNSMSNQMVATWDSANRKLLYLRFDNNGQGQGFNTFWSFDPAKDSGLQNGSDPNGAWQQIPITTIPANTPSSAHQYPMYSRYAVYDPVQNFHYFKGTTSNQDGATDPFYEFFFRLDAGGSSNPPPPPPPPPPVSFLLTLTRAGTGSGTMTGAGSYQALTAATLGAVPVAGSTFSGWSPAPCASTFMMPSSALTCTATFTLNPAPPPPPPPTSFSLVLATTGTGSGPVTGGGSYAAGVTVALGAVPATGSTFSGWSPAPCASTFMMPSSALTCTATFTLNPAPPPPPPPTSFSLVLATTGTGSGPVTGGGSYTAGVRVTLGAVPAAGSTFSGWSPSPCASTFMMPSSGLTCTATFTLIPPPPSAQKPTLGTITPSPIASGSAGFNLAATGTAFASGLRATVGGQARTVVLGSATQATIAVLAADVITVGNVAVQVTNPGSCAAPGAVPGGTDVCVSNTQQLVVVAPTPAPPPAHQKIMINVTPPDCMNVSINGVLLSGSCPSSPTLGKP